MLFAKENDQIETINTGKIGNGHTVKITVKMYQIVQRGNSLPRSDRVLTLCFKHILYL